MASQKESENVGSSTPTSAHSPSPPPGPPPQAQSSSFQKFPPRAPSSSPSFVDVDDGDDDGTDEITSKGKKLTSWVWGELKRVKEEDGTKAICNHCKTKLSAKASNGTKHLSDHLRLYCPKRHLRTKGQTTLRWNTKKTGEVKLEKFVFNQQRSRKELAEMIVMHEYPLSMVDHFGFRQFVSGLNPDFQLVSRNTLRSDIMKMFEDEKSSLKKLLETNQGRIAITTDMWTASNQKKGYMVVTAHFVDDNWVLHNRTLRFLYVPHPHTSDALAHVLMDQCIFQYNLESKLSSIVVDNCSTNDSMMDILLGKLDFSSLILDGKFLHMRCSAHILNLIVRDGLDVIGNGVERIRDCVAFWVSSPKRFEKFEDSARFLKISSTKKIHLDCKTRWNSTYLMLESALPYRANFERLKRVNAKLNFTLPTDDDWKFVELMCEKLRIFYEGTLLFSGRNFPTSNLLFRLICNIKLNIQSWMHSEIRVIREMAFKMDEKFDKYWGEMNGLLAIASILDPRNKMECVDFYFDGIYKESASMEIERVSSLLYNLLVEYIANKGSGPEVGNIDVCSGEGENSMSQKQPLEIGVINDMYAEHKKRKKRKINLRSELDSYLQQDVLADNSGFDILNYWKNETRYPTLRLIARDILAIPVSTVASESAFSMGGRVVSPHRSRLHGKTVESLMCLQNWMIGGTKVSSLENAYAMASVFDDSDFEGGTSEVIDPELEYDLGME